MPDEVTGLFSINLILPAALGPGFYSVSNRNEYQKEKNMFVESRAWPPISLTTSLHSEPIV
jgi:hypothetical protein